MTGLLILYVFTLICGCLQIVTRDKSGADDSLCSQTGRGVLVTVLAMAGLGLIWLCTELNFPETQVYAWIITGIIFITTIINKAKLATVIYFGLTVLFVGGMTSSPYSVGQYDDTPFRIYHPCSYWITHKVHATGHASFEEKIIARRGQVFNVPDTYTLRGLRDIDGNIHIPGLCDFRDGYKKYEILFFNDDPHSVNVVRLTKEDGSSVILDWSGNDTQSPDYSIPTFYDDIDSRPT